MKLSLLITLLCFSSMCPEQVKMDAADPLPILPGIHQLSDNFDLLKEKKIGLVVNQSSLINDIHLVDYLMDKDINVSKVFTPEHGYKGQADAGEKIADDAIDAIPILSLYGKKKKPTNDDLDGLDVILFDIQDVGVRFYTYISTLHYVMEAAAENNIPIVVLDRPNPNGFYVDGPVLDMEFSSFVGMHPVPVVYGMTIGEYAQMINGEGWLNEGTQCDLTVLKCQNYDHTMTYDLPIKPSPNLPNLRSILLYPSLCFFEGTNVSIGRGTTNQFQVIGHPILKNKYSYKFTPVKREGAKYPKHENVTCYGLDISAKHIEEMMKEPKLDLSFLINLYSEFKSEDEPFFINNNFFDKLAGSDQLKKDVIAGKSPGEIRLQWKPGLEQFNTTRAKYLLY